MVLKLKFLQVIFPFVHSPWCPHLLPSSGFIDVYLSHLFSNFFSLFHSIGIVTLNSAITQFLASCLLHLVRSNPLPYHAVIPNPSLFPNICFRTYGTTDPWPDRGEDLLESCMSLGVNPRALAWAASCSFRSPPPPPPLLELDKQTSLSKEDEAKGWGLQPWAALP